MIPLENPIACVLSDLKKIMALVVAHCAVQGCPMNLDKAKKEQKQPFKNSIRDKKIFVGEWRSRS